MALAAPMGQVYAVECDADACALVRQNQAKFAASNLTLIEGKAPEALQNLPAPDAVFIGGSKGQMQAVVDTALAANPKARICIAAIALETLAPRGRTHRPRAGWAGNADCGQPHPGGGQAPPADGQQPGLFDHRRMRMIQLLVAAPVRQRQNHRRLRHVAGAEGAGNPCVPSSAGRTTSTRCFTGSAGGA